MSAPVAVPPTVVCQVARDGDRLTIRWEMADWDRWRQITGDFRRTFPKHSDRCWRTAEGCWSVPYRLRSRLAEWWAVWFGEGDIDEYGWAVLSGRREEVGR